MSPIFVFLIPIVSHGTYIKETSGGIYVDPDERKNKNYDKFRNEITSNLDKESKIDK